MLISYLFLSLFNIIAGVLTVVSIAFVAYSLFTVYKGWNKGKNQDLFNLLVVSGVFLIIVRIFDLIVKKSSYYYYRSGLSLVLILIAVGVPIAIYAISKSSGDEIYEEGYLNKLTDMDFLKAEVMAALGLFMNELENISSKVSRDAGQAKEGQRRASSENIGPGAYKYTEDPGDFHGMLKENRSLLLFIVLNIITCGLYMLYFVHTASRDANIACAGDGENTSGVLKYAILSILTCGIYSIYWDYALANRLAANGPRYGYTIQENGSTFLLWFILGGWICGLGYFVARNITIKNLNKISRGYNKKNPIF